MRVKPGNGAVGSLSYSAIAKIVATVSKGLESDKYLRKQIKGLEVEYSFCRVDEGITPPPPRDPDMRN